MFSEALLKFHDALALPPQIGAPPTGIIVINLMTLMKLCV